jgi:hypothetical protein
VKLFRSSVCCLRRVASVERRLVSAFAVVLFLVLYSWWVLPFMRLYLSRREGQFLSLWGLASGELTGKRSYLYDWASWLISSDLRFEVSRFLVWTIKPMASNQLCLKRVCIVKRISLFVFLFYSHFK